MHSGARGRREFDEDVAVVQPHRIIAGRRFFILMTEARSRSCMVADGRHQQDIAVVGNTGATEMRVAETVNNRIGVVITRAAVPTRQSRVRTQLDHAERHDGAGKRVTVSAGADKWVDVTREVSLSIDVRRYEKYQQ